MDKEDEPKLGPALPLSIDIAICENLCKQKITFLTP